MIYRNELTFSQMHLQIIENWSIVFLNMLKFFISLNLYILKLYSTEANSLIPLHQCCMQNQHKLLAAMTSLVWLVSTISKDVLYLR